MATPIGITNLQKVLQFGISLESIVSADIKDGFKTTDLIGLL